MIAIDPLVTHEMAYRLWFKNVLSHLKWYSVRDCCLEDTAQETFVIAGRCWEKCREESKRQAWLFGLAKNTARNHVRSCRFGCRRSRRALGDDEVDQLSCPWSAKSDPELREIYEQLLALAVDVLSAKEYEVFVLHVVMDLTSKEVEYLLGIPEKGVYELSNAARRKLAVSWKKRQGGDVLGVIMLLQDARGGEGVRHLAALDVSSLSPRPGSRAAAARPHLNRAVAVAKPRAGMHAGWQSALVVSIGVGFAAMGLLLGEVIVPPSLGSHQPRGPIEAPNYETTTNIWSSQSGPSEAWQVRSVKRRVGRPNAGTAVGSPLAAREAAGVRFTAHSSVAHPEAGGRPTAAMGGARSESDVELDRRRLVQVDKALKSGRPEDALTLLSGFTPRVLVSHTKALEGIARCASGQVRTGREVARAWLPRLENRGLEQRLRSSCDLPDGSALEGARGRRRFAGWSAVGRVRQTSLR